MNTLRRSVACIHTISSPFRASGKIRENVLVCFGDGKMSDVNLDEAHLIKKDKQC